MLVLGDPPQRAPGGRIEQEQERYEEQQQEIDLLNLKAFLNVKEESHALDKGELVIRRIWKDMNLSKYGGTCTSWSVWDKWSLKRDGIRFHRISPDIILPSRTYIFF